MALESEPCPVGACSILYLQLSEEERAKSPKLIRLTWQACHEALERKARRRWVPQSVPRWCSKAQPNVPMPTSGMLPLSYPNFLAYLGNILSLVKWTFLLDSLLHRYRDPEAYDDEVTFFFPLQLFRVSNIQGIGTGPQQKYSCWKV